MAAINEEKYLELKETFNLFTTENPDRVAKKQLGNLLRASHQCPSEKEIKQLSEKVDDLITFEQYLNLYSREGGNNRTSFEELKSILALFDEENLGVISILKLKDAFINLGEPFTEEEFDNLIKWSKIEVIDGTIDYDLFIKKISL